MVRQVASDWGKEVDPTLSIERLDTPAAKPQLSAAEMSARLAELPNMIANASSFFVDHVEGLRRDGFINKFRVFDLTNMTGLVGQFYYEGAYQLAPDEALLVERSEEHTSELQSLMRISYAVFCLKKKTARNQHTI